MKNRLFLLNTNQYLLRHKTHNNEKLTIITQRQRPVTSWLSELRSQESMKNSIYYGHILLSLHDRNSVTRYPIRLRGVRSPSRKRERRVRMARGEGAI